MTHSLVVFMLESVPEIAGSRRLHVTEFLRRGFGEIFISIHHRQHVK